MEPELRIFEDKQKTAEQFAIHFKNLAEQNDPFHVALSGGTTPKILFAHLAKVYKKTIDWNKIHFWWGDERCVPPYDDDSNFKTTRESLFDNIKIDKHNIHRVLGESIPDVEAKRYSARITELLPSENGLPVFDLIILGMGDDGHTVSIFPHQMRLLEDTKVCSVSRHPNSGQNRITLTGKVVNNAKEVAFLVTGESKKDKVAQIIKRTGDYKEYPASYIEPTHGSLYWYLDQDAAADL